MENFKINVAVYILCSNVLSLIVLLKTVLRNLHWKCRQEDKDQQPYDLYRQYVLNLENLNYSLLYVKLRIVHGFQRSDIDVKKYCIFRVQPYYLTNRIFSLSVFSIISVVSHKDVFGILWMVSVSLFCSSDICLNLLCMFDWVISRTRLSSVLSKSFRN